MQLDYIPLKCSCIVGFINHRCVLFVYFRRVATLYVTFQLGSEFVFNPLNPELNPICYLLALLVHHFLHVSRIRVKSET